MDAGKALILDSRLFMPRENSRVQITLKPRYGIIASFCAIWPITTRLSRQPATGVRMYTFGTIPISVIGIVICTSPYKQ
jgi:hypothetical protein